MNIIIFICGGTVKWSRYMAVSLAAILSLFPIVVARTYTLALLYVKIRIALECKVAGPYDTTLLLMAAVTQFFLALHT